MIEQKFGPRRCRDTRKPLEEQCPRVVFYRCPECKKVFAVTGGCQEGSNIVCCNTSMPVMEAVSAEDMEDRLKVDYQITGGYNDNAVKVTWKAAATENNPEWIYLKTFTGGYLKYVADTKRPPMVFALADTDAFAYCDEDPCLECVFRCKRGFVIYVCTRGGELIEVPLDRMRAHWQSGAK